MNIYRSSKCVSAATIAFILSCTLHASESLDGDVESVKSVEEIKSLVESKYQGKVTEIELDKESSRYVYEVEVRNTEGYEWDVELDAVTGEILKEEKELDD